MENKNADGHVDEQDMELLNLQKRKSMPTVVIQEFVASFSDDEEEILANKEPGSSTMKEKTHIEIDNVRNIFLTNIICTIVF